MRSTLGKFRRLDWRDRFVLVEAMMALGVASAAIAILPFRRIGRLAELRSRGTIPSADQRRDIIRRVRWSLLASARRAPWRALCFEQGLAAQWMLRRRGIPSVLYYGAAPNNTKGLAAHVWVRDGNVDVIGGETASEFALLTTFPSRQDDKTEPNTRRT
jgi:hypothetical protein